VFDNTFNNTLDLSWL